MNDQHTREESFITRLDALNSSGDRGALAALRRGLGKPLGTVVAMHPIVAPFTGGLGGWAEDAYYLVAALFASHPESTPEGTFGTTLKAIMRTRSTGAASLEKRFMALLDAEADHLPDLLRPLVALARSVGQPVNWARLLRDLVNWNSPDRWVQRRWARDFYQDKPEDAPAKASLPAGGDVESEGGES
jgi:CRISPR system Cascade subunit CasB